MTYWILFSHRECVCWKVEQKRWNFERTYASRLTVCKQFHKDSSSLFRTYFLFSFPFTQFSHAFMIQYREFMMKFPSLLFVSKREDKLSCAHLAFLHFLKGSIFPCAVWVDLWKAPSCSICSTGTGNWFWSTFASILRVHLTCFSIPYVPVFSSFVLLCEWKIFVASTLPRCALH